MSIKILAVLGRVRDTIDGLSSGDDEAYDEGVYDSVCVVDELMDQWTNHPESMAEELNLDN